MQYLWNEYLFTPLFNLLIYLYNNYTFFNLGLAVIYLTIILRIFLLPLSILSEKDKGFRQKLDLQIKDIERDFPNDKVKQKEAIRDLFKQRKIKPWAQVVILGVQFLVLVVLYQVFIGGIQAQFQHLYTFISKPDFVNVDFLGFDISKRNFILSGLVGVVLFLEITFNQRARKYVLTKSEVIYRIMFPIFCFLLLYYLPSVKSIFILTSIFFSIIITLVTHLIGFFIFRQKKA